MLPILYSYRRCPYAMRARMAIQYSGISVQLREIKLSNKPAEMLQASPKGTVPVLVVNDDIVIEQSRDIMLWVLNQADPNDYLCQQQPALRMAIDALIDQNDQQFKHHLDRYKYADRYPEHSKEYYRAQGELFLQYLEHKLNQTSFLLLDQICLADIALFPFIRQFAGVDPEWFNNAAYPKLKQWLYFFTSSTEFAHCMQKFPVWQNGNDCLIFP